MAYTLTEALSKLGTPGYSSFESLVLLVKETSVTAASAAPNAVTLLYSGNLSDDVPAWRVANSISDASNSDGLKQVITIADTPAGQLLRHDDFKAALCRRIPPSPVAAAGLGRGTGAFSWLSRAGVR
jgi:hypothetical protein